MSVATYQSALQLRDENKTALIETKFTEWMTMSANQSKQTKLQSYSDMFRI